MAPQSSGPLVVGVDVGGTTVKAAVVDANLGVVAETRRPSVVGPAILDVVAAACSDLLAGLDAADRDRVVAVGVAIPGIVDAAHGVSVRSVNLDLTDVPVAGPLAERLGLPVRVGHDVQAAGEAVRRAAPPATDPFVVVIGTGIAGVSFVGGSPVAGVSGQAGEFGHVVVRPDGPECQCGNRGCVEAIASASAIARSYTARSGVEVAGAHEVLARLGSDPVADQVWEDAVSALADALLTVCALLAPGAIEIGGGLSEAGEQLTGPLAARMVERAHVVAVPPLLVTGLGSRAGLVGAAHLALDLAAEIAADLALEHS